ncbi:hypothetical protein Plhal304r1_c058g0144871 [Plasmopara halstedii]
MARSKAQQRVLYTTPSQFNNAFEMKPQLYGISSMTLPANSAPIVPGSALNEMTVTDPGLTSALTENKYDLMSSSHQRGSSSSQVIDLTLEDDEEEEDEPMGKNESINATAGIATTAATSSAASDTVDANMIGDASKNVAVAHMFSQAPDMVKEAESDVDEDWPVVSLSLSSSIPMPVSMPEQPISTAYQPVPLSTMVSVMKEAGDNRTQNDSNVEKIANRTDIPDFQGNQKNYAVGKDTQTQAIRQHTCTNPLGGKQSNCGSDANGVTLHQTCESGQNTADLPSPMNPVAQTEALEDGEIYEEGGAPATAIPIVVRSKPDVRCSDTAKLFSKYRNKKQKKRGKKKGKRKLEVMQMKHLMSSESPFSVERSTRQRVYSDVPSGRRYMLAMTVNDPRGSFANVHPVFRNPAPLPFQNAVGLYPPVESPPHHLHRLPHQIPCENSQILRVNRLGSMEMLGGETVHPPQTTLSEQLMQRSFIDRSVSMSPVRPVSGELTINFQRPKGDQLRVSSNSSGAGSSKSVSPREHRDDDFDLDSLRAAALRSKMKRTAMADPLTLVTQSAPVELSVASMSFLPNLKATKEKQTNLEPANLSSENELRLEILRSMTRKREQAVNKTYDDAQKLMPPAMSSTRCEMSKLRPECANPSANVTSAANKKPDVEAQMDQTQSDSMMLSEETNDAFPSDRMVIEKSISSEKNVVDANAKPPLVKALGSVKSLADKAPKTLKFRPLTACKQSVVICLSPEDYSPHNSGDDTRSNRLSLQDAIEEMRRKIAEREQEQANRLLVDATKKPSGSSLSEVETLLSTSQRLSPVTKVSSLLAPLTDNTASSEVGSLAIKTANDQLAGAQADPEVEKVPDENHAQTTISEGTLPVEARAGDCQDTQEHNDTIGVSTFVNMHALPPLMQSEVLANIDGRNEIHTTEPCKKSTGLVAAA